MAEFTEGQKVLHVTGGGRYSGSENAMTRRTTEVTVVKIGRTLAHVDHGYGRLETYRLDTGVASKDFGGRIVTAEDLAAEDRRTAARVRLREDYGWTQQGGRHASELPADAVEKVLAYLDAVAGR